MVRTRKNHNTTDSSKDDDSYDKTVTESNINNMDQSQQLDISSNINTNESQPFNNLRTSTLDDRVIITNSLETLSPKSVKNHQNIKIQPQSQLNPLHKQIPYLLKWINSLHKKNPILQIQMQKNNKRIKRQPQLQLNTLHNLLKNNQLLWIQMQKKTTRKKNTSAIPTELAAETESSSSKGIF